MKQFQCSQLLIILISLATSLTEARSYAKPGCNDTCGNVRILYPFGIGTNCSLNKWYTIECNSSTPYLSAFNNLELSGIALERQTVTVKVPKISNCQKPYQNSTNVLNSNESPFLFAQMHNIFITEGCGNGFIMNDHGTIITGCSTTCLNDTISDANSCFGVGCCQTFIPYDLKSFRLDLTALDGNGGCGFVYLMDKNSFVKESGSFGDNNFVPVSLLWTLKESDYDGLPGCIQSVRTKVIFGLGNNASVESVKCECGATYEGNPYLDGGCKEHEECARCEQSGGNCIYNPVYNSDLKLIWNVTCVPNETNSYVNSKTSLRVILGVSISMGLLSLSVISYVLYKVIKKTKDKRRKERFFRRNGGLLLKQQEATNVGLVDKTILFTSKELEKATDHFNENRIIGRGGQGTVYKGMLADGRIVAIKKSKVVDESQLEQFINEVVILSQINHRNVVKLLGCCLETEVPLLVSEFISNGTLYDLIHDESGEIPFSLNMRLQIAAEIAGALSYLHSATSIPIYHRDIKTTNILLDEKYRAKVSDFGTSRFVSIDQTHLTTLVKGTFGYLDPEYFQTSQFTEKSDVYSFGVVLLELFTRGKPISLTESDEHRSLATRFMLAMEEGRVMSMFDGTIIKEGSWNEISAIAHLAMRCLNLNGKNRPTMKEVALELEGIRMSHVPTTIQAGLGHGNHHEEVSMLPYGDSLSTTMSFNDNTN